MAYALAITGHAGDDGAFTSAAIANGLHVAGAAMWGGGIVVAALVMLPVLRHCDPFPRYTLSFASVSLSSMSTLALALVLFPGIYHAWLQLGSVNALWETLYSRWLMAKMAFVGVMIVLGALNRFLHVPEMERLADESALATSPLTRALIRERSETSAVAVFIRNLRLEGAFLVLVLIGAAVLSQQTPSIHEHHQNMMSEQNLHQH
jgi:putative copper export protein